MPPPRLSLLTLVLSLWLMGCSTVTPIPDKHLDQVNGHTLEYATAGTGSPVIVFISGGGPAEMDLWGRIYQDAAHLSTVFAYNRFGDGRSDQVDEAQTGRRIVTVLRMQLQQSELIPPYVLVGHSLGGLYANLYARLHPDEVAGVVLVDASHPGQAEIMRGDYQGALTRTMSKLFLKLYAMINPTKYSEFAAFDETAAEIRQAGPFPDIPLIVLTAGRRPSLSPAGVELINAHQRSLAALSPQGRQIVLEQSGHMLPKEQPAIIVQAIQDVVAAIRDSE